MRKYVLGFFGLLLGFITVMSWLLFTINGQIAFRKMLFKPDTPFAQTPPPLAVDYAFASSWAALPGVADNSDIRPPESSSGKSTFLGLKEQQNRAVDVFFIHPTTFILGKSWNSAVNVNEINFPLLLRVIVRIIFKMDLKNLSPKYLLDKVVLRYQASAFNQCCRVYVPRYRQASMLSFFDDDPSGVEALKLAYSDIHRAFDYFLRHYNRGRPFIIAAHSQGSVHGMRLLQEQVASSQELSRRLVAAYVIGSSIPANLGQKQLRPCSSPKQTGCYINWNTVSFTDSPYRKLWYKTSPIWLDGKMTRIDGRPLTCVNPLNWQVDGMADAQANSGALGMIKFDQPLLALVKGVTGARCEKGLLVITPPQGKAFRFGVELGDYHLYDYSLFYANIRDNAMERALAFLRKKRF